MNIGGERQAAQTCLDDIEAFESALKEMADQVAVHTGQAYFEELVKYLSSHFGLQVAVVGMLDESGDQVRTLALGNAGRLDANTVYPLHGSPCEHVVRDGPRFHEDRVQALYPEDRWFREIGAHGYAGVPLHDDSGKAIGLISAVSVQPLPNIASVESFFKVSGARASAELDRLRKMADVEASELRYSLAESGTTDGLWDIDMRTRTAYCSPRVSELLGVPHDQLKDDPERFLARVHPADVPVVREAQQRHLQQDAPFDVQYRIRHADGRYRWFRTRGKALRDADGTPVRFSGSLTDITEGKQQQQLLQAENAWLAKFAESPPLEELLAVIAETARELFEDSAVTLCLLDARSCVRVFPLEAESRSDLQAWRALAARPPGDAGLARGTPGWPWQETGQPFDRMRVWPVLMESVPERIVITAAYSGEKQLQPHEGHFIDAAVRIVQLALEQLRHKADLERQRLLFENLFECAPEAMVILDRNDQVIDSNPRFTEIFQFTPAEARGKPLNDLIVPLEFAREAQTLSRTAMRGSNVVRESFRRRKDGTLVPVSILGAPITVSGVDASYFAVYRDQSSLHEATRRLDHQSRHDLLTGLPNRYEFERRLQQAMALSAKGQGCTGVLYFDLDQFKVVNDTAGHARGDDVLQEVTHRLRPLLPAPHLLVRLGGDEFAVLLVNGRREDCEQLAQQIRDCLAHAPFRLNDRTFAITASFGIVVVEANAHRNPHEVMGLADSACFLAKERGRDRVQVYDPADMGVAQRREEMDWISRLNEALLEDRFQLHYQRIVPVGDDRGPEHYELLLRMVDQNGAVVPPGMFIPPAERYNLMPRVDRWVLETTFRRLGERGRHRQENLLVAVNISGSTLSDDSLPEFVVRLFEQHPVRPESVCFEITETAAIANFDNALEFIGVIRRLGCRVALDDFGSGFSSFRYLKEIAPDYLKIDGSFVRDITRNSMDYSMLEAINRVGKIIGIHTVAEFVEDETIFRALRKIGVDYAQGYAVHRPEPWDHWIAAAD